MLSTLNKACKYLFSYHTIEFFNTNADYFYLFLFYLFFSKVKVRFHETKGICSHAAPDKPFQVQLAIPAQDIGVAKLVIVPLKAGNFTMHIEVYEVESNTLEIIEKVLHVKVRPYFTSGGGIFIYN